MTEEDFSAWHADVNLILSAASFGESSVEEARPYFQADMKPMATAVEIVDDRAEAEQREAVARRIV